MGVLKIESKVVTCKAKAVPTVLLFWLETEKYSKVCQMNKKSMLSVLCNRPAIKKDIERKL